MTALLILPAVGAFHSTLPAIHQEAGDGDAAWGIQVDRADTGDIVLDLEGAGPASGQEVSAGAVFFNDAGQVTFMFAFTSHLSPDRVILPGAGTNGESTTPTQVSGDPADLPFEVSYAAATADAAACPFFCLGLQVSDAAAGSHSFIAWLGGVESSELTIRAEGQARAITNAGDALVAGDTELSGGTVNAQVQQTATDQSVGAKVINDASHTVDVGDQLWGFWASSDFKLACQFSLGACLWASQVVWECTQATGMDCGTAKISWDGPGGGEAGSSIYSFEGLGTGDYAFNVDQKVDAYGPSIFETTTGTLVNLGESYSYLTVADVALP